MFIFNTNLMGKYITGFFFSFGSIKNHKNSPLKGATSITTELDDLYLTVIKNIATGETSQVITSFDYYNFHHYITFITR